MAIELDIQKNFKGFSLDVRLKGQDGSRHCHICPSGLP